MSDDRESREAMRQEILQIVGGDFTPDSVGPERYQAIAARVRARPADYVAALESIFLAPGADPALHAELRIPVFYELIKDVAPELVRASASRLLAALEAGQPASPGLAAAREAAPPGLAAARESAPAGVPAPRASTPPAADGEPERRARRLAQRLDHLRELAR